MENKSRHRQVNAQVYEEACEWFLEFRTEEPNAATRKEFDNWIRRSPEYVAAYLQVAAVWSDPASHDARRKWDIDTLVESARGEPDNVVPLAHGRALSASEAPNPDDFESRSSITSPGGEAGRRRTPWLAFAASLLIAAVGTGIWYYAQWDVYRTATGEQRSIRLDDGSTIDLNSRTIIRVRYREHERNIELAQGQALFNVARDVTRPFVVDSNGTKVRAVGTQFDVYRKSAGTVVTVLEGKVAVSAPTAPAATVNQDAPAGSGPVTGGLSATLERAVLLAADEQVIIAPNAVPRIARGTAATAVAWTSRKVVFSRASLAEVAEEFNRYSTRELIVEEPGSYDFHVSGVFSSTDVGSIVRFLRTRPGLEVEESGAEIRVRKKAI